MYPIIYGRIHYRRTWSIKIKSSVKTGLFALIIDERKSAMKVGVDLGGSHIGMGIIDDNGRILEKKEIELYNIQNMQEFIIDSISNEIDYYIKNIMILK